MAILKFFFFYTPPVVYSERGEIDDIMKWDETEKRKEADFRIAVRGCRCTCLCIEGNINLTFVLCCAEYVAVKVSWLGLSSSGETEALDSFSDPGNDGNGDAQVIAGEL